MLAEPCSSFGVESLSYYPYQAQHVLRWLCCDLVLCVGLIAGRRGGGRFWVGTYRLQGGKRHWFQARRKCYLLVARGSENSEELQGKQQPRFAQHGPAFSTESPTFQETPQLAETRTVGHPRILGTWNCQGHLPRCLHSKRQGPVFSNQVEITCLLGWNFGRLEISTKFSPRFECQLQDMRATL